MWLPLCQETEDGGLRPVAWGLGCGLRGCEEVGAEELSADNVAEAEAWAESLRWVSYGWVPCR